MQFLYLMDVIPQFIFGKPSQLTNVYSIFAKMKGLAVAERQDAIIIDQFCVADNDIRFFTGTIRSLLNTVVLIACEKYALYIKMTFNYKPVVVKQFNSTLFKQ